MGFIEDFDKSPWCALDKHRALLAISEGHLDGLAEAGTVCDYYGAAEAEHEFQLDHVVFKVLENPEDGYRSSLGAVIYGGPVDAKGIMFRRPIARVRVEKGDLTLEDDADYPEEFKGYHLVDADTGHVWLRFGTEDWSDYYPCFIFTHRPAPGPLTDITPGVDQ
jgi:hypothetical protein